MIVVPTPSFVMVGPLAILNCAFSSSVMSFCFLTGTGFVQKLSKYAPLTTECLALASEAVSTPLSGRLCQSDSFSSSACGSGSTGRGVLSVILVGRIGLDGPWTGCCFAAAFLDVTFPVLAALVGFDGVVVSASNASENLLFKPGSALILADVRLLSIGIVFSPHH